MEKVGHGWTRSGESWRAGDGVSVVAGDVAGSAAPTPEATEDLEEHEGSEGWSLDSIDLVNEATWCVHQVGKQETWPPPTTSSGTCKEKPRPMLFHVQPSGELILGNLACHFMWTGGAREIGVARGRRRVEKCKLSD